MIGRSKYSLMFGVGAETLEEVRRDCSVLNPGIGQDRAYHEFIMTAKRLIPQPESIEYTSDLFKLSASCSIFFDGSDAYAPAAKLKKYLTPSTGFKLPVLPGKETAGSILVRIDDSLAAELGNEGYTLQATSAGVTIEAATGAGAFYGVQTLRQLLPVEAFAAEKQDCEWTVPGVNIIDKPRFEWRGIMLDEGRHWYGVEYVKKFIDLLALHKYNILHWHLTENAGWRIEIKRYPKLQTVGAWRDRTVIGNPHQQEPPYKYNEEVYGGFYTQDEVREIVAYAAQNYITVVPEIDMPAHSQAALAAYPEMGCTGGPYDVMDIWDYSYDNFCAGDDKVFTFLENILDEVCDLFPSEYIHIGGDECKKDAWNACPKCQQRIKDENLADADELQSYFISRIAKYMEGKQRKIIGWDEISEGGAIPNAAVMLWLQKGASFEDSAEAGNPMVVSLHMYTYFDYCQGNPETEPLSIGGHLPLSKTYNFDPAPADYPDNVNDMIMGTQGQIWSQYIVTTEHLEYMTFPRAAAIAENGWASRENKDYDAFFTAMPDYLKRLELLNVNYRNPEPPGQEWSPEDEAPSVGV